MNKRFITAIMATTFVLASCGAPQNGNSYIIPQQIDEPEISDITPVYETQTERVNNCDGTIPFYNVSYKTIEAQKASFEVSVGAGGLVAGTPIPSALEVQLEAKITAALAKDYSLTTEKNHDLTINNEKGSFLVHTITWKVSRVKGLIEVVYGDGIAQVGFEKIANVELYDHTSSSLGCGNNSVSILPTTTIATLETQPPDIQSATPSVFYQKGDLLYECDFTSDCEWIIETGAEVKNGNLLISPGYDAVLGSASSFDNFILEAKFLLPSFPSSMSFYIRHQRPECADWNCSIQIGLYNQEAVARRFLGDKSNQQIDIIKNRSVTSFQPNDWNIIVIVAQGNNYTVYINDTLVLEFTDNTYSKGSFIIDNAKDSTSEVIIDYFRVYIIQ